MCSFTCLWTRDKAHVHICRCAYMHINHGSAGDMHGCFLSSQLCTSKPSPHTYNSFRASHFFSAQHLYLCELCKRCDTLSVSADIFQRFTICFSHTHTIIFFNHFQDWLYCFERLYWSSSDCHNQDSLFFRMTQTNHQELRSCQCKSPLFLFY